MEHTARHDEITTEVRGPGARVRAADLDAHRRALTGHCYRMLGSAAEADDAVQDTFVRAWRALDGFDGRASLRTWLFRIATNVCLDALATRSRRELPIEEGAEGTIEAPLVERPRTHWLEPVPDAHVVPAHADPAERALARESIRLAFVAALQHLPPRQRAALLLAEVVGWSASEIAEALETTVPAVNSALQRARATLAARGVRADAAPAGEALPDAQRDLLDRYVRAFETYDVERLTSLLREDAVMSMPPYTLWLRGPAAVAGWFLGRGIGCKGSRLVPVAASGQPAFGQYKPSDDPGVLRPWSLVVLDLAGDRIAGMTHFLDVETLFPRFGLPMELRR